MNILGDFLPPNFCKSCSNDLELPEMVFPIKLHKVCENHQHWTIFAQIPLFQRTVFNEIWKKKKKIWVILWLLLPLTSISMVLMTWYAFWISKNDDHSTICTFVSSPPKSKFFSKFSQFSSKICPLKESHSKNLIRLLAPRIIT